VNLNQVMTLIKQFLVTSILLTGLANASTVSLTPINDGRGTIGPTADFAVVNGTITTNSLGYADIILNFNYQPVGAGGPSTALGGYSDGGLILNAADLLFEVGNDNYGIPVADHSGSPNGAPANLFASVVHGNFYESSTILTPQTVLNNSYDDYRHTADVWLGGTVTDLGQLTETVTYHAGQTPSYIVELKGQLPAQFLADVAANNGFQVEFGSATCGNGYLVGSEVGSLNTPTPEPSSFVLIGLGLLALSLLTRARTKNPRPVPSQQ